MQKSINDFKKLIRFMPWFTFIVIFSPILINIMTAFGQVSSTSTSAFFGLFYFAVFGGPILAIYFLAASITLSNKYSRWAYVSTLLFTFIALIFLGILGFSAFVLANTGLVLFYILLFLIDLALLIALIAGDSFYLNEGKEALYPTAK